jgi:eukaryotic-like serine/threonine-protein kinase
MLDGKYRLIRRVGAGGMGSVYVAEPTDGGGPVAVKLITSREHAANPAVVERFYREAHAAGRIDTPHIARVLDVGTDPESGAPYMVMELLKGQDLHRFTKRVGPLDPELMLRISAQACRGLAKAHEASVIHRDIKSANIFLACMSDGSVTVKLLDFGIAKLSATPLLDGETSAGLTRTGMLLGSPLFMSPEQTRGTKRIDHRSDIWSFGMVMFRMLAGRAAYEHIRAVGELIFAICSGPPPLVQNLAPWVPPELAGILERALRVDPDERYQSADDLHAALAALLGGDESIAQEMLVGISAERRAVIAPRFDGGDPVPLPDENAVPVHLHTGVGTNAVQSSIGLGPVTAGSRRSSAGGPRPAWVSGPGLQQLPGLPATTATTGGGHANVLASAPPPFPGGRSTDTEQGMSNSASLIDIPAFRPSRTPVLVAGGVVVVLIAAAIVQLNAGESPEQAGHTEAAPEPTPHVEAAPAAAQQTTARAAAPPFASAAQAGSGSQAGAPFRDDRGPGQQQAGPSGSSDRQPPRWAPAAPRPATATGWARRAPSSSTSAAPAGNAPAPLDPNGFGDRK